MENGTDELSRKQKKRQKERDKKLREKQNVPSEGAVLSAVTTTPSPLPPPPPHSDADTLPPIAYVDYEGENQLPAIMTMVDKDLSEPYSIFTYRYFLQNWPQLCILALLPGGTLAGVIVCKAEREKTRPTDLKATYQGYIAMLAVSSTVRRRGIGSSLVRQAMSRMVEMGCDEAVLETEVTNQDSLRLYGRLGFSRDERLVKYYLNGVDAFRLKLWFDLARAPAAREALARKSARDKGPLSCEQELNGAGGSSTSTTSSTSSSSSDDAERRGVVATESTRETEE